MVGTKEFYGINLSVNNNVLIPRPETEMLVEESLKIIEQKQTLLKTEPVLVADVGTGSGAISVALASKIKGIKIYALDISEKALEVTRQNINKYQLADIIIPIKSDLLGCLQEPVDLIVANLPYIKQTDIYILAPEIRDFEPSVALDGGDDGTEIICKLLINAGSHLKVGGHILLEIGQGQVDKITDFICRYFNKASYLILDDYNGIARILKMWFQSSS